MVIFYNPTEARSTLSFNTLLIYLSSLAYAPWRPRRIPSPDLPLYGEEKEYSIAKVFSVYRACMLSPLLGARK